MSDLVVALGLVLVIEGVIYAAFPSGLKRMLASALATPDSTLRAGGLAAAVFGLLLVWLVRG
ncbi:MULTISPECIES: DUF2065 domain-containing protein [Microbaculum]|uniref:DUF2065 domain-containing protein n=1 Tax=Microbaculum marinisediminis TaxID=2931392 RepID=A0AAW5R0F1_9HYPH|nr:DUF2065 domain-containing protein [Microbaculum sp. A6E488]MCT8972657.1 DUF2065 domain-containing protein [Microbaculum sp. A6E488]